MAYSDTRGFSRFSPASVGAALAINGIMLSGFVLLKPEVLPEIPWTVMETFNVPTATVDVPDTKPAEDTPKKDRFTPPPKAYDEAGPKDDTGLTFPRDDGDFDIGPPGGGPTIIDPPVHQPVLKIARLDPRFASALQPDYPPGLVRNEVEGVVTVRVLVGADGRVKAVEAVRADEAEFLEVTRKQALKKWRFLPATRDGEAVESWREMTVRFMLPD